MVVPVLVKCRHRHRCHPGFFGEAHGKCGIDFPADAVVLVALEIAAVAY